MTTASAALWRSIEGALSRVNWTSLQDVYSAVEEEFDFDEDDLLPEVGDAKQRAWQRNVRNVLKNAERRFAVERDPTRAGFYRLCEARLSFEVRRIYNRAAELHGRFGGQQQGEISTPADHPFIFLFTGESGQQYGYSDGWDQDGVFIFTGEGQKGDMQFVRGNLAIRDHIGNGKALHLFESLGKSKGYRYIGEFCCATWENRRGFDVTGNERATLVFHLVPVASIESTVAQPEQQAATSTEELLAAALASASDAVRATESDAKRIVYERSKAVRDYVLARAKGVCESCRLPAPFERKDGTPYLEPHHTRRVSDGGPDHPRWVGAICPNCHTEIHFGRDGAAKNRSLQDHLGRLEDRDLS